jgi:hypothetical protein
MQHRLIEMFGGLHGVRDKGAVEAAVFRPQTVYYNSILEEAAALMESLGNNHGFLDGNKPPSLSLPPTSSCDAMAFALRSKAWTDTRSSTDQWTGTNFALRKSSTGSVSTSTPCLICPPSFTSFFIFVPVFLRHLDIIVIL